MASETGETIGPFKVPFVWHSGLYHCGANVQVPGDGRDTTKIRIAPPRFIRHNRLNDDRLNDRRYADTIEVRTGHE